MVLVRHASRLRVILLTPATDSALFDSFPDQEGSQSLSSRLFPVSEKRDELGFPRCLREIRHGIALKEPFLPVFKHKSPS